MSLTVLLLVVLLGLVPAAASAHGGTDHGERVVDGRLHAVEVDAPPGSSVQGRAGESWRATGPRAIAIVQVLMPGRDAAAYPAYTEDELRTAFVTGPGSASRALSEMTDGIVSLTGRNRPDGDVTATVTASSSGDCRWQQWANDAKTQLAAKGQSLTPYLTSGNVAYVLRGPTGCSWSGLAWMPGTEIWLENSLLRPLIVHELGHNFSLDHAASARCRNASGSRVFLAVPSRCTVSEYGDYFDPMGIGDAHYSATQKAKGGWLPQSTVKSITQSGTHVLGGAADRTAATRMLRIPRPDGRDLTIELRRPNGTYGTAFELFSTSQMPVTKGITMRLHDPDATDARTQLLDAVFSTNSWNDAALPVGTSVTDTTTGITVRLDALAGDVATVAIGIPGTPDTVAPSAPQPTAVVEAGRVTLSWPAASDNAGVTAYRVGRDGVPLGETNQRTWTDIASTTARSHSYVVTAIDAAGNATPSQPLVVSLVAAAAPVPAPEPPSPGSVDAAPVVPEDTHVLPVTTRPPGSGAGTTTTRPWRAPATVRVDGRSRSTRLLAHRGGGTVRGRSVIASFSGTIHELRVNTKGCTPRVAVRAGKRWATLKRPSSAHAAVRSSRAIRQVRVRCASGKRMTLDQLAGR